MIDISFEFNGKKVNPNDLGNALEKAVLGSVEKQIMNKVGLVRCPHHGQTAKIVCKGQSFDSLSFEVYGCCQVLIDEVKAQLK
jgi:hypothetical protein